MWLGSSSRFVYWANFVQDRLAVWFVVVAVVSQEDLNVGMHSTFDHFVTFRIKRDPYASLTYISSN